METVQGVVEPDSKDVNQCMNMAKELALIALLDELVNEEKRVIDQLKKIVEQSIKENHQERPMNEFVPKTDLGRKLLELRQAYIHDGGELINADQLDMMDWR